MNILTWVMLSGGIHILQLYKMTRPSANLYLFNVFKGQVQLENIKEWDIIQYGMNLLIWDLALFHQYHLFRLAESVPYFMLAHLSDLCGIKCKADLKHLSIFFY